jgi:hypothetical protein
VTPKEERSSHAAMICLKAKNGMMYFVDEKDLDAEGSKELWRVLLGNGPAEIISLKDPPSKNEE